MIERQPGVVPACALAVALIAVSGCDGVQQALAAETVSDAARLHIPHGEALHQSISQDGSQYSITTHEYPSGLVRVLRWTAGSGPVFRRLPEPARVFIVEGSLQASDAEGAFTLVPGDAAILSSATLQNDAPVGDTVILEFVFENDPAAAEHAVMKGESVGWVEIAQWYDAEGQPVSTRDQAVIAAAPDDTARLAMRHFPLNDVAMRQATLQAGSVTIPGIARSDVLLYVVRGRMRRFEDEHVFEVSAGDSIREAQGGSGYWEVFEDAEVVATDAPAAR